MTLTFAIGDVHDCIEQLDTVLEHLETRWNGGKVVFLGDYVDRGPDSRGVVARIVGGPTKPAWN